jgi:uncharacterized protein
MYEKGQGMAQDYNEAVKWFRLAAEQGYAGGQANLGTMYGEGKGVPLHNAEIDLRLGYLLRRSQGTT